MGSNKGNHPKHGPGYVCHKRAKGKKAEKDQQTKRIAAGKKRVQALAKQAEQLRR